MHVSPRFACSNAAILGNGRVSTHRRLAESLVGFILQRSPMREAPASYKGQATGNGAVAD